MNDWHGAVPELLAYLRESAKEADDNAAQACRRSKYAVQDYWLCIEAWTQRLHRDIAAKYAVEASVERGPFQVRMDTLRRALRDELEAPHAD